MLNFYSFKFIVAVRLKIYGTLWYGHYDLVTFDFLILKPVRYI